MRIPFLHRRRHWRRHHDPQRDSDRSFVQLDDGDWYPSEIVDEIERARSINRLMADMFRRIADELENPATYR